MSQSNISMNENRSIIDEYLPPSNHLSRKVVESLHPTVSLVSQDVDNDLSLYCYDRCNEHSDENVKNCRGVVFSGDRLIMQAFPYTTEYTTKHRDKLEEKLVGVNLSTMRIFNSSEGTLLRFFKFNGKWFLSTHRKLNAFNSRWASGISFGERFTQAIRNILGLEDSIDSEVVLTIFGMTLDDKYKYMFLLQNCDDNRLVCRGTIKPTIMHVGTFDEDNRMFDYVICAIPCPERIYVETLDELIEYVKHIDINVFQGVILFMENNKQIKLYNDVYFEYLQVRGNQPNIMSRYLDLRMNDEKLNIFKNLFPEYESCFKIYEDIIYKIAEILYRVYIERYINKKYVKVSSIKHSILVECHGWHQQDRTNNRVGITKIIKVLNSQESVILNILIKEYMPKSNNDVCPREIKPSPLMQSVSSEIQPETNFKLE